MNHGAFVKKVARRAQVSQDVANSVIAAFTEEFIESLDAGNEITLYKIGRFKRHAFNAGKRRSPTGAPVSRVAFKISFKPTRYLRNRLKKVRDIFKEVDSLG